MEIKNLVRKNILSLKPYTSARQSHLSGILLDANENSYGSVLDNFTSLQLNRYPDPQQTQLREALGEALNIPPKNLFFGVGSDEIIDLLIRVFCYPGKDKVIVCEPTYGMYKVACDINDAGVTNVPLVQNFQLDTEAIKKAVDEKTKIIFICSPNNPSSNLIESKQILELAKELNVLVAVDEAYIDFSENDGLINKTLEYPNLVIMRTFSKAWGLAGVRCGFCAANEEIIDLLFKVKAPYNMNKLTSNAILGAIKNISKRNEFVKKILSERKRLEKELRQRKKVLNVLPSDANFISFKVDSPQKVFSYLESNGIVIRDRSNQFNFGGYLRLTVGTEEENNLFLKKLDEIL
ncbi:MAG: histidinol-phosphate transaminase [Bacteroidetes bacterium]|nr:histidinol-phosphate transaminase [Bacteroidota bacterium]